MLPAVPGLGVRRAVIVILGMLGLRTAVVLGAQIGRHRGIPS